MSNESLARRALEIFDEVLDRPEAEWEAFLAQACGDDAALRREVDQLVAAHARADGMLEGSGGAAEWVRAEDTKTDSGIDLEQVVENTGFPLVIPDAPPITAAPTAEQLAIIAALDPHNQRAAQIRDNPPGDRS